MAHLLQAVHAMLILAVLGVGYWQRWQYWVGLVRVVKGTVQVKLAHPQQQALHAIAFVVGS